MSSDPTRNRKFQKNSKKIKEIKKHHYDFFSGRNKLGKAEKERKKIVPTSSYLTRNRKFQKNSKKLKKLENTIMGSFRAKICRGRPRKGEKKNRSDEFRPNP